MNRILPSLAATAALASLLAGCATTLRSDYLEPVSGPTARFTVVNRAGDPTGLYLYEDHRECTGRRLVVLGPASAGKNYVNVPAAIPLSFTVSSARRVSGSSSSFVCEITGTFTPQPNQTYVTEMLMPSIVNFGAKCGVQLRTQTGRVVATNSRRAKLGWTDASNFCTPD